MQGPSFPLVRATRSAPTRRVGVGESQAYLRGFAHPDMFAALAESIPESSARMGVVYRHCIATAMLCHTTSQLFTAESTLDSTIAVEGLARLHQSNA